MVLENLSLKSLGLLEFDYCEVPSNQSNKVLKMGPMHLMVFFLLGLFHSSLAKACLGCSTNGEVNDPAAFQYISNKLQNVAPKGMENEEQAVLVRIKELKKQVVEGMIYTYGFEAKGLKSNSLYECKLVVLLKEWMGVEEVEEYNCKFVSSNKQKRSLPGSEFVIDAESNSDLQELKSFIGTEVGKKLNSKYLMKVVRFFKASEQIVEGSLYRATIEVAKTNCLENSQSDSDECQIQQEDRHICDVQVWYRPWLNKKEVDEVHCRPQPEFCAGCPVETNPGDVTAQQCLKRALSNLNARSNPSSCRYQVYFRF
ncbi:unnamed protein product [Nezara viridula]|uniref:Cystatin domain-containing protein n=1 Tax=Nezara viridula TaxID=85310 RepID=A0A9P0GWN8_NEZVI|nr:unnamed protein product [Nezara viridula]